MTNLEQLTAKIQKLVPEIMELKFGCVVNNGFINLKVVYEIETGDVLLENGSIIDHKTNCKILGRNITLEDVLKARLMQDGCPIKYNEAVESDLVS